MKVEKEKVPPKYYTDDEGFSIQYMRVQGHSHMPETHFHPNFEIYYLLEGKRVYFIHDRVYTAQKGDMVIINPGDVHRTTSDEEIPGFERILINFTYKFMQPLLFPPSGNLLPFTGSRLLRFSKEEQVDIEHLLKNLLKECREKKVHYESSLRALLLQVLIRIRRFDLEENEELCLTPHPMHQKISEIASYLNHRFDQEYKLEDIAKKFYISPSYLSRVFKKITGFHMSEYVRIMRIREAQRLLRDTNEKVMEISNKVGFQHIAHFNKTFKKIVGMPPLTYRKISRTKPSVSHQKSK